MLSLVLFLLGCPAPTAPKTTAIVANLSQVDTTVYVAFGSDSRIQTADWSFCSGSGLTCSFPLAKQTTQDLPLHGQYLNATFSFFQPVTCNTTKGEVNLNNPNWYDVADISLVDGFNVPMRILFDNQLISVLSPSNNESALGVYPNGCDICVARENPPCGMSPGTDGCKSGTQYDPAVPCQLQGTVMGGGSNQVIIELLDLEPA